MNQVELAFIIGTIGFLATIFTMYIGYECFFIKEHNPILIIEEPFFFGPGCLIIACIFFRMMISGAQELGLLE